MNLGFYIFENLCHQIIASEHAYSRRVYSRGQKTTITNFFREIQTDERRGSRAELQYH